MRTRELCNSSTLPIPPPPPPPPREILCVKLKRMKVSPPPPLPLSSLPPCSEYNARFKSEETQLFCLRVMVGVIILYDHVHPVGAFALKAAIDVRRERRREGGRVGGWVG